MNKQLEKKIEKIESLKAKKLEERAVIDAAINDYDKQLKVLQDYKKTQEKIYKMQEDLDIKIKEN